MSPYCFNCGRTIYRSEKPKQTQLDICFTCKCSKEYQQKLRKIKIQQQKMIQQQKVKKQQLTNFECTIKMLFQQRENSYIENEGILNLLNKDIEQYYLDIAVYQSQLENIKKSFQQYQLRCIICNEQYNALQRQPMLICISQHHICKRCLNESKNNKCPKCSVALQKDIIKPFREKRNLLRLRITANTSLIQPIDSLIKGVIDRLILKIKRQEQQLSQGEEQQQKSQKLLKKHQKQQKMLRKG